MTRRSDRFPDTRTAGRSNLVPFQDGEGYRKRHARRKYANIDNLEEMQEWCEAKNVGLQITNRGEHWQFTCPNGGLVEWWPSSAKMVFDKQWSRGIYVHDWQQATREIEKYLR